MFHACVLQASVIMRLLLACVPYCVTENYQMLRPHLFYFISDMRMAEIK